MVRPARFEWSERALTIGYTYWVLPCLQALCDFKQVERFIKTRSKEPVEKFVRGYSLVIVLLLERLLNVLVDSNPFDLDANFVLSRAYQGDVPYERMPTDSEIGVLVRKIALLYLPFFRPATPETLENNARHLENLLLRPLKAIFEDSIDVEANVAKKAGLDKWLCIRRLGLVNAHLFLCELKKVEIGFYQTFLRKKGSWRRTPPSEFYPGYKMSVAFLLNSLREPESSDRALKLLLKSKSWKGLENQYRTIQSELVTPIEDTYGINDFMFTKIGPVPESLRTQLLLADREAMHTTYSTRERLQQAFLWLDTKVVGTEGITFSSAAGVITTMTGVLMMQKYEPVRITQFEHPAHHGSDFSYAVLVPAYSNLGNYSEWWVFPDFANNVTGGGGAGYEYVESTIDKAKIKWKDRIHYQSVQVPLKDFLDYVNAPSTIRHDGQLARDSALLGEARGWLLELATGSILRAKRFTVFHRIRNTSILGDLELDIIGIQYDHQSVRILTAECSASFSPRDISRIRKKIVILRKVWPQLLRYLKVPLRESAVVEGWLVTAQRLPASKKRVKSIRLFDAGEMERLATEHGISWNKMRRVFPEEHPLGRRIRLRGFPDLAKLVRNERL